MNNLSALNWYINNSYIHYLTY